MQQFPNYSMNQMNMNQPNMGMYQGYNQTIANPYMDRMNQLQQYQQSLQPPVQQQQQIQPQGIIGRIVNDFSEITANDVPMNGNAAFFPKADGSEMQVRSWSADGTIQTIVYKPVFSDNSQDGTNIPQMDFNALNEDMRALREEISERFDRLEKSMGGTEVKKTNSRAKKEVNSDE